MSNWVERVKDELVELEERIHRLGEFFDTDTFKGLDPLSRTTLGSQFMAMNQYATCLRMRMLVATTEDTVLKDESNEQSDPAT